MNKEAAAAINQDDFFEERPGSGAHERPKFRKDLMVKLRTGPPPGEDDLSTAIALTGLVWDELTAYGTGGGERLTDGEMELAQRTLRVVLERLGVTLRLPWRNFTTFRSYWMRNDARKRRSSARALASNLPRVVASHGRESGTGWRSPDAGIDGVHTAITAKVG